MWFRQHPTRLKPSFSDMTNGTVVNHGADRQTILAEGKAELYARYRFYTDDGATIEIRNHGDRHAPPQVIAAIARGKEVDRVPYYTRTHARLETGDQKCAWVNRTPFAGTGARQDGSR